MFLHKKLYFTDSSVFLISALLLLLLLHCVVTRAVVASNNEEEEDYYEILGLGKEREDATEQDIKAAWRKQTRKHHPDVSKGSDSQIYERIRRAYDVLGNRKKRKMYDIMGHEGVKKLEQPEGQQHSAMQQFFSFFGGGGGEAHGDRGRNEELLLLVLLEDVYSGATHAVKLARTKICRACRGSGARSKEDYKRCPHCHGEGRLVRTLQLAPGFVQQVEQACGHCGGGGRVVAENCPVCGGKRVVRDYSTVNIDIERGVPEGHRIVHELEADQQPNQIPGDVIFTVTTIPHQRFERDGDDLTVTVQLTLKDALLGFKKELLHIDGHAVNLVEVGVIQHLTKRVILGEGMPRHSDPSKNGNLNVIYKIILPAVLTEKQKEVVKRVLT